ncbi:TetR/AcrR family transcriptional regulator [Acinetobacter ursingii]|uniref:TetR/AcrR family transcriptional regulator n=1 Tax=Acinetobacter ursingii TaxID=108980 RepID=UPI002A0481A5|nr:TetR/AcrR family transcriptional regulator [Acinetobacter ursingii]MCU4506563.1 TetR/AcrR family transcriptional regulator [Acinetobacter ursingii]MCU4570232.1 TetR/AcrR family transcriptional regulator [Acinetobacter ursingii]
MKITSIKVRRKPKQSRARFTQDALMDSFVQLLLEKEANAITIREITDLAGVGLGTFYEYFSKKEDLLALTIHHYVQRNAHALQQATETALKYNTNLKTYINTLIHLQIASIAEKSHLWQKLFLLERQISNTEIYQKHYSQHVEAWCFVLKQHPEHVLMDVEWLALNIHRISYGFISQTLMVSQHDQITDWERLEQDIQIAIYGFIQTS